MVELILADLAHHIREDIIKMPVLEIITVSTNRDIKPDEPI
jgi:hypothetical protein